VGRGTPRVINVFRSHRLEPGKTLLEEALRKVVRHPAWVGGTK